MKITRKQLRRLIETRIKPNIPNVPNEELLGRIDNFARDKEMQPDADSFAGSFGYPEDRSYVDDLATYDAAGRVTFDSVDVATGQSSNEIVTVPIPYELVDELIRRHQTIVELENQGMRTQDIGRDAYTFRLAAENVFRHIHDYLDDKYGRDNYDIQGYGAEGAGGYRHDEYEKAMMKAGEFF